MGDYEYKSVPVGAEVKLVAEGAGSLAGYPSVYGILDDVGDIALPGSHAATIPDFLRKGFTCQSHDWSMKGVIGYPTEAREDERGLYVDSHFHSTPDAQAVRTVAAERMAAGKDVLLSIGYKAIRTSIIRPDDYKAKLPQYLVSDRRDEMMEKAQRFPRVRLLQENKLFEYSIVPVPALMDAAASDVKGATGATDLPLAPRDREWDVDSANERVRKWAGAEDKPNEKYRRAFFWYDDSKPEEFGSYHLQFADIVDGELKAVPRGIFAVANVLQGGRGADLPPAMKDAVKSRVAAYYTRMKKEFDDDTIRVPWEKDEKGAVKIAVGQEAVSEVFKWLGLPAELIDELNPVGGLLRGLPAETHSEAVLAANAELSRRLLSHCDGRRKEGRVYSAATIERLKSLRMTSHETCKAIDALMESMPIPVRNTDGDKNFSQDLSAEMRRYLELTLRRFSGSQQA